MAVTLRDIAERTNLSLKTVSRILNGTGENHNAGTRELVHRVAQELGYRPNTTAKAMRSGRSSTVALLLSETPYLSLLPSERFEGMLDVFVEKEINLLLVRCSDEALASEGRFPRIVREIMADGLLINYNTGFPEQMSEVIRQHQIPVVWINSLHPADCVFPDDREGGRRATEHLLRLGHTRIAFATHIRTSHYSFEDRLQGCRDAVEAANLTLREVDIEPDFTSPEACARSMPYLLDRDRPTAFLTYSTETAFRLLYGASLLRLSVPADFSLMTVHVQPVGDLGIPMDTLVLPEREMGRAAARMLLQKIDNPSRTIPPLVLPLSLVTGATSAPPPPEAH